MPTHEPTMNEQYESPLGTRVVEEVRSAFETGDIEAFDELLRFCPRTNLIQYLPEEEWFDWMTEEEGIEIYGKETYFKLKSQMEK